MLNLKTEVVLFCVGLVLTEVWYVTADCAFKVVFASIRCALAMLPFIK